MTYDPDRDAKAPDDVAPHIRPGENRGYESGGFGMMTFLVGSIMLAVVVTLAFLMSS